MKIATPCKINLIIRDDHQKGPDPPTPVNFLSLSAMRRISCWDALLRSEPLDTTCLVFVPVTPQQ